MLSSRWISWSRNSIRLPTGPASRERRGERGEVALEPHQLLGDVAALGQRRDLLRDARRVDARPPPTRRGEALLDAARCSAAERRGQPARGSRARASRSACGRGRACRAARCRPSRRALARRRRASAARERAPERRQLARRGPAARSLTSKSSGSRSTSASVDLAGEAEPPRRGRAPRVDVGARELVRARRRGSAGAPRPACATTVDVDPPALDAAPRTRSRSSLSQAAYSRGAATLHVEEALVHAAHLDGDARALGASAAPAP